MNYYKKYPDSLKNPLWLIKRKEIFSRDNHTCQKCLKSNLKLHCHHIHYHLDWAPWEHPLNWLITVCERCHNGIHKVKGGSSKLTVTSKEEKDYVTIVKKQWLNEKDNKKKESNKLFGIKLSKKEKKRLKKNQNKIKKKKIKILKNRLYNQKQCNNFLN